MRMKTEQQNGLAIIPTLLLVSPSKSPEVAQRMMIRLVGTKSNSIPLLDPKPEILKALFQRACREDNILISI